jgi:hypothetical protein
MLARRLRRRGVGVSTAALAAALPQQAASGSVPASMLVKTIKVTTLLAAGELTAAGATSAPVFTLTEGELKTMALVRIKTAGVMLSMVALVLCGGMVTYHALAAQPAKTERPPGKRNKPNPNDDIKRAIPASGGRAAGNKNVREVAKLRSAELLQKAQNTHAILSRVMKNKVAWNSRYIDITDLYEPRLPKDEMQSGTGGRIQAKPIRPGPRLRFSLAGPPGANSVRCLSVSSSGPGIAAPLYRKPVAVCAESY